MARSNITGTRSDAAATAPRRSAGVVLLVEDEPSVRTVTRRMLEIRGYTVLVSESPEEAIRVLASYTGSVDVLLTDVKLPGMDGVELAAQLRRSRPGLKVVFTSGYARDEAFPDPTKGETVEFLQKPFTLSQLSEVLERTMTPVPGSTEETL